MTYEGKIIFIGAVETVGKNAIQKRSFVLEEKTDREYKGSILIDLVKDKVTLLDGYNVGDTVKVSLNSRASEYNWRWYNSLTAWKIEGNGSTGSHDSNDDLPF